MPSHYACVIDDDRADDDARASFDDDMTKLRDILRNLSGIGQADNAFLYAIYELLTLWRLTNGDEQESSSADDQPPYSPSVSPTCPGGAAGLVYLSELPHVRNRKTGTSVQFCSILGSVRPPLYGAYLFKIFSYEFG